MVTFGTRQALEWGGPHRGVVCAPFAPFQIGSGHVIDSDDAVFAVVGVEVRGAGIPQSSDTVMAGYLLASIGYSL